MYTFTDAAKKMFGDNLENSTIEKFEEDCLALLKYREECRAKGNTEEWEAKLKSIMEGV